jgi:hypothetical protein
MEDLEEDRQLGPWEASEACDLLSMHGYPIYAQWAAGPSDDQLLPFLALVTHWLGEGRDALFSEFGLPTYRRGDQRVQKARGCRLTPLVEEEAAATYTTAALEGASSRRLSRRIALVLLRLRPVTLGAPALRSRSPWAHLRTLASRRLAETSGRRSRSVRRRRTLQPRARRRVDRHRPRRVPSRSRRAVAPPLPPISGAKVVADWPCDRLRLARCGEDSVD